MRLIRAMLCLAPALLALDGCRVLRSVGSCHKPQPYMSAQTMPTLKVPAGLDAPDTSNALRLPALNEPPPPRRSGKDPCLDAPPSFKVTKPKSPQA